MADGEVDAMAMVQNQSVSWANFRGSTRRGGRLAMVAVLLLGCASPPSNGPGGGGSGAGSGAGGATQASSSSGEDLFDAGINDAAPGDASKPAAPNLVPN